MFRSIKRIHAMYYIGLIFLIFPIMSVVTGSAPLYFLGITLLFVMAYFAILLAEKSWYVWLSWLVMLAYILYASVTFSTSYVWFFFYLANLLNYRLGVRSLRSSYLLTFMVTQLALLSLAVYRVTTDDLIFLGIILIFIDLLVFGMIRTRISEEMREAQAKQNAQINLLLAENERNRIGQDLHDSLGHTFAMMSVKLDLALQLLNMQELPQVEKELHELHDISTQSMQDVRRIVENLKKRTLSAELETVRQMLELAGITSTLDNRLDQASLSPESESALAMILLELATNVIKHAKATQVIISLWANQAGLHLVMEDDGRGFKQLKGDELHSIKERLMPLSGQVVIENSAQPTRIKVDVPYKEK